MKLDWQTVWTLAKNDLRLLLRSRRTLIMSVVLPLLMFPVMIWLSSLSTQRQITRAETTVYR